MQSETQAMRRGDANGRSSGAERATDLQGRVAGPLRSGPGIGGGGIGSRVRCAGGERRQWRGQARAAVSSGVRARGGGGG
jgi:hypothetical protein